VDAPDPHTGEERLEVEAQHHAPARVGRSGRQRRPAGPEAVRGRVDGDLVEDVVQHLALQILELPLGGFDQPQAAAGRAGPAAMVVAQPLVGRGALHRAAVGEPGEVVGRDPQPRGQRGQVVDRRHGPPARAHAGGRRHPHPHVQRALAVPGPQEGLAVGDEGRQLAGAVARRLGVGPHHHLGQVEGPAAPVAERPLAQPAQLPRLPRAGRQERAGQRGGDTSAPAVTARGHGTSLLSAGRGCAAAPPDRLRRACAPVQRGARAPTRCDAGPSGHPRGSPGEADRRP
jgi:hypothetical protein